ncbi:hypothetical protein A2U01_0066862, partial [Trifolium medium]|nr:hypothetical protein [Trifolium medium]
TGTDETGPSRPRGNGTTSSVRREKAKALEEAGGRRISRHVARTQPQPEPQGDPKPVAKPVHVAEPIYVVEPIPDPAPAPATEEDDGDQLGEADFQEDDDAVQEGAAGK